MHGLPYDPIKELIGHMQDARVLNELANAVPYPRDAEAALAGFLLKDPGRAAALNAAELAAAAGVSEATLYRLCKALGYRGYGPLKERLRELSLRYTPGFIAPVSVREKADPAMSALQWRAYYGMRAFLDASTMDEGQLEQAIDAIARSERLSVAGIAPLSGSLAKMAAASFQMLGMPSMLWTDVSAIRTRPTIFGPQDVVIAISHSGESTSLVDFLADANEKGATTIALVNYLGSSIARVARIKIVTRVREGAVENADLLPRAVQLLVLQHLVDGVRERRRARPDHA